MKKIAKIALVFISLGLLSYNGLIDKSNAVGSAINLETLEMRSITDSECALSEGQQIYGTYCWVTDVTLEGLVQFEFDTFWCNSACHMNGTNCCYTLEARP